MGDSAGRETEAHALTGDFNHAVLRELAHRPWAVPSAPWVMTQTWRDLLFAHWPVDPRALRPLVAPPFELDLYDGDAWISIVPFLMANVGPRGMLVPRVSEFAELNVRTYVRVGDRPGVYFFSLDAASRFAVRAARLLLNLPYYLASIEMASVDGRVEYDCRRTATNTPAEFRASYRPAGPVFIAVPGSRDYFLT